MLVLGFGLSQAVKHNHKTFNFNLDYVDNKQYTRYLLLHEC